MAKIFVKVCGDGYDSMRVSDKLPVDSKGTMGAYVDVCKQMSQELGIVFNDRKIVVEYEVTVKEVAKYKVEEVSPWKKF